MKRFGTIMMAVLLSAGAVRLAAADPETAVPAVQVAGWYFLPYFFLFSPVQQKAAF